MEKYNFLKNKLSNSLYQLLYVFLKQNIPCEVNVTSTEMKPVQLWSSLEAWTALQWFLPAQLQVGLSVPPTHWRGRWQQNQAPRSWTETRCRMELPRRSLHRRNSRAKQPQKQRGKRGCWKPMSHSPGALKWEVQMCNILNQVKNWIVWKLTLPDCRRVSVFFFFAIRHINDSIA